jgi:hypothetical protein
MFLIRLYIFSLLFFSTLNDVPKDKSIFISPLKIPAILSSNFGELRIDHFHSGIDIKTQGVTGKEVVAAADGYIYRIGVSPGGFGNALYIKHRSGYSTVYGHLDRFAPDIEEYVRTRQYEKKSFTVTLFPDENQFPVIQGELIAYSGNSGGSGGPHLHYEIRKSDSEKPVNPLLFEFGVTDNIKPVIDLLAIYPINRHTLINNKNSVRKINVSGSKGNYSISSENEISISGLAGFGIKTYDLMNESPNRCGVYSIELSVDSVSVFSYVMEGFSFTESRYVNSHIDYETFIRENIYIERLFVLPGDRLTSYKYVTDRGVINFNDGKIHKAQIIVTDVNNNRSSLSFKIKAKPENGGSEQPAEDPNVTIMPYNKSNRFTSENISINIPSGALYDTLRFTYKKVTGTGDMYSDVFYVHNKYTPVHKAYTLSILPRSVPAGLESKMLIVQLDDDNKKIATNSRWSDEYLTADLMSFGRFFAGIDTIAPFITPNGLVSGANLSGRKEIRIRIKDDLSGIKSYELSIDGKWALFEYDQKNDVLIYHFDDTRLTKGSKHNLLLKVTDNKDNTNTFKCDFSW